MFRTTPVHHQERFVQAVFADWYVVIRVLLDKSSRLQSCIFRKKYTTLLQWLLQLCKNYADIVMICVYSDRYNFYLRQFTLVAGLLAKGQYPEGPATGHLGTGFAWFLCVCLQANAKMVPKTASCYCMLLM